MSRSGARTPGPPWCPAPLQHLHGPGGSRFLTELKLREGPRRQFASLLALDRLLRLRDRGDHTRDRCMRRRRRLRRRPLPDARHRPLHRHAHLAEVGEVTRFPSACHPCPGPASPRPCEARTARPASVTSPARYRRRSLGARRGRPTCGHRRRTAAGRLRADRQARRQADRQDGRRPPRSSLLLRPTRRRNPLPGAPGQGAHHRTNGGPS